LLPKKNFASWSKLVNEWHVQLGSWYSTQCVYWFALYCRIDSFVSAVMDSQQVCQHWIQNNCWPTHASQGIIHSLALWSCNNLAIFCDRCPFFCTPSPHFQLS
jgi:uncharacterized protein with NAD-binding domain and iron-sulfur cluster